jgi:hypothetical protein
MNSDLQLTMIRRFSPATRLRLIEARIAETILGWRWYKAPDHEGKTGKHIIQPERGLWKEDFGGWIRYNGQSPTTEGKPWRDGWDFPSFEQAVNAGEEMLLSDWDRGASYYTPSNREHPALYGMPRFFTSPVAADMLMQWMMQSGLRTEINPTVPASFPCETVYARIGVNGSLRSHATCFGVASVDWKMANALALLWAVTGEQYDEVIVQSHEAYGGIK